MSATPLTTFANQAGIVGAGELDANFLIASGIRPEDNQAGTDTDDTASFLRARDKALLTGGSILLAAATYQLSAPVDLDDGSGTFLGCSLVGAGSRASILVWKPQSMGDHLIGLHGGSGRPTNKRASGFTVVPFGSSYNGLGSVVFLDGQDFVYLDDIEGGETSAGLTYGYFNRLFDLQDFGSGAFTEFLRITRFRSNGNVNAVGIRRTGSGGDSFRDLKLQGFATLAKSAVVTGAISGSTLTVSAVAAGAIEVGQYVGGASSGTQIVSLGTGSGSTGTYIVNNPQTVGSGTLTLGGAGIDVDGGATDAFAYLGNFDVDFGGDFSLATAPNAIRLANVANIYYGRGSIRWEGKVNFTSDASSQWNGCEFTGASAATVTGTLGRFRPLRYSYQGAPQSMYPGFSSGLLSGAKPGHSGDLTGRENAFPQVFPIYGSGQNDIGLSTYVPGSIWAGVLGFGATLDQFVPGFRIATDGTLVESEIGGGTFVLRTAGNSNQLILGANGRVGGNLGRYPIIPCAVAGATAYNLAQNGSGFPGDTGRDAIAYSSVRVHGANLELRVEVRWNHDGFGSAGYLVATQLDYFNSTGGAVPALNTGMLSVSTAGQLQFAMPAITQTLTIDYSDVQTALSPIS